MEDFDISHHSHRRYNPLTGEWILVSPHRAVRPWQGQIEKLDETELKPYEPYCYLCPGNTRAGGHKNPEYTNTFIFVNDFSSLLPDIPCGTFENNELLKAAAEPGICKVICFAPGHNLSIPQMKLTSVRRVIDLWIEQYIELGELEYIRHIQIFENKGSMMGCSNPHPHCQIWAQQNIPVEVAKEQNQQSQFFEKNKKTLLSQYIETEQAKKERLVCSNESFIVIVPFWAVWPFETIVISRRAVSDLSRLSEKEKTDLADIYIQVTTRYDNLFQTSFPYSMGIHQAPTDKKEHPEWHMHLHFYPPLLRSATIKKFMVGYELLANPQRDITAEQSADKLRALSSIHYKNFKS